MTLNFSSCTIFQNFLREGFKKNLCKFTHLDGWVGQECDKLHRKKHAFKIHFRPFLVIIDQLFFTFLGGVRPGTESSSNLCPHLLSQPNTTVATNTTSTSVTHCYHPPLMPPTTSIHHCTTHHGGGGSGVHK